MTTSVASVNPRLISAVSSDPAGLLAAAAAELARRWVSGDHDLDDANALADLAHLRGALGSLTGLFDDDSANPAPNLYDLACDLADDGMASRHAAKPAAHAGNALKWAAGEPARALDRYDDVFAW
jgi:hypothetical protein